MILVLKKPLTQEQTKEFVKLVKMQMIWQEISLEELANRTGYSKGSIYNALCSERFSKFLASAIAECLDIDLGKYEKE